MNYRILRVGEKIRHALSDVFIQGKLYDPVLEKVSVTISEVRVSPDLKHATVYVCFFAQANPGELVKLLNQYTPVLKKLLAQKVPLRFVPELRFKFDESFDNANAIGSLLHENAVPEGEPVDIDSD